MKKLIAIALCVLILSALALPVFADNGTPETTAPVPATTVPSPTSTGESHAPTDPNKDNGNTSPKTGDTNLVVYGVVLLCALFGVVVSVKKLAKNQY